MIKILYVIILIDQHTHAERETNLMHFNLLEASVQTSASNE